MRALIHIIGNDVVMSDMAQMAVYYGLSPIMSNKQEEWDYIHEKARGLLINIGTNSGMTPGLYLKVCASAIAHQLPILLDPVGCAGIASRRILAKSLLKTKEIKLLKCNQSELMSLYLDRSTDTGVDGQMDWSPSQLEEAMQAMIELYGCGVVVTGEQDLIGVGSSSIWLPSRPNRLKEVVGSGCLLGVALMAISEAFDRLDQIEELVSTYQWMGEQALHKWQTLGEMTYKHYWMGQVERTLKQDEDLLNYR